MSSSSSSFDHRRLIQLVQNRPVIWDRNRKHYKDRTLTKNAWTEIFKELRDDYEQLDQRKKNEVGQAIVKKWTNIRDCFMRSQRRIRESADYVKRTSQPPREYVYGKQLQFLTKNKNAPQTDECLSNDGHSLLISENSENVGDETEPTNVFDHTLEQDCKAERDEGKYYDRHETFLLGIIPSLGGFSEDDILEFQLRVLQAVSDIRKSKVMGNTGLQTIPSSKLRFSRQNHSATVRRQSQTSSIDYKKVRRFAGIHNSENRRPPAVLMVREYIRKTNWQSWSADAMSRAVDVVVIGGMSVRMASIEFDLPISTLNRYVKKKLENPEAVVDKKSGKHQTVFTAEQEMELVSYIKTNEKPAGLTLKEFRREAYQLAEKRNLINTFNRKSGMAGEDWIRGFLKRHPDVCLRRPKGNNSRCWTITFKEGLSNSETDATPCATTSGTDHSKRPRSPQLHETRHPKRTKYPPKQIPKTESIASFNTTKLLKRPLQQDEFDTFGQHVANQLRNLPLANAIICQNFINNYLAEERLKAINEGYFPNVDTTNSIFEEVNPHYSQSAKTDSNSSLDPEDFLDDNSLDQNLENIVKIENTNDT